MELFHSAAFSSIDILLFAALELGRVMNSILKESGNVTVFLKASAVFFPINAIC
jgi:hypothetical protein